MLDLALLLVDVSLMVVLWVVQVIIYPSFRFYAPSDLRHWHPRYTILITYFVLPLMFLQLAGHAWALWQHIGWIEVSSILFIASAWLITFFVEVPYHGRISEGRELEKNLRGLIRWNWPRTIAWSLVVVLDLLSR